MKPNRKLLVFSIILLCIISLVVLFFILKRDTNTNNQELDQMDDFLENNLISEEDISDISFSGKINLSGVEFERVHINNLVLKKYYLETQKHNDLEIPVLFLEFSYINRGGKNKTLRLSASQEINVLESNMMLPEELFKELKMDEYYSITLSLMTDSTSFTSEFVRKSCEENVNLLKIISLESCIARFRDFGSEKLNLELLSESLNYSEEAIDFKSSQVWLRKFLSREDITQTP